ncbi:unnamed protein product, partial [Mesorhabditis belari]|uniref:C-type lectin domain-containing protein n=1 Tax=Mesorhabditis belari TaxID=2138241 RepID=A0AAF3F0U3_9BILA
MKRFLIFSTLFSLILSSELDCPVNWLPVDSHELCLYIGKDVGDWDHVVERCVSMGGYPAIITDAFINSMIRDELTKAGISEAYIGVTRYDDDWRYANGKNLTYKRWNNGEPRKDEYKGLFDVSFGGWKTTDDFQNYSYVCTQNPNKVKCDPGWTPFGDFCYWSSGFTFSDGKHWNLFNFTQAEQKCRELDVHLASIHSQAELEFIYDLIATNLTEAQADAAVTDENGCTHMWAWSGLYHNGVKNYTTWTDGTPLDFVGKSAAVCYQTAGMVMLNDFGDCYDLTGPSGHEYWEAALPLARYVCKKEPNQ